LADKKTKSGSEGSSIINHSLSELVTNSLSFSWITSSINLQ